MAKSPSASAPGQNKVRKPRVLGPRTLWLILKPGADPAQVREMIEKVTFNGRTVLSSMGTGVAPATVKFVVDVEKRGGVQTGNGSDEDGEDQGYGEDTLTGGIPAAA